MYEALVAYTGITQFGYEQAKQAGNDAFTKGYQKIAGQSLQTVTKMSPYSMNFTSEGLTVTTSGHSVARPQPAETNTAAAGPGGSAIEVVQVARAYEVNEVDANGRFTGKRITVIGTFEDVQIEDGKMALHFIHTSDAYANYELTCYLAASQQNAAASLQRGQRVTIEGVSKGRTDTYRISMENCVIVSR